MLLLVFAGVALIFKEGDFLPCYHPLKAFVLGEKDGKRVLKVTSYEVDHLERSGEGFACMRSPPIGRPGDVTEFVEIPGNVLQVVVAGIIVVPFAGRLKKLADRF